jgi:hypothetical protein
MRTVRGAALLLVLALPLLAACGTSRWTKAGTTKDAIGADLADCRAQGQALVARDAGIDEDIMASRGLDWHNTDTLQLKETTETANDREREQHFVEDCMRAKGYAPAS